MYVLTRGVWNEMSDQVQGRDQNDDLRCWRPAFMCFSCWMILSAVDWFCQLLALALAFYIHRSNSIYEVCMKMTHTWDTSFMINRGSTKEVIRLSNLVSSIFPAKWKPRCRRKLLAICGAGLKFHHSWL